MHSSDDRGESNVVVRNQKIVLRLKFKQVNGQLLPWSLRYFMRRQCFSLLALRKCLTHIAILGCQGILPEILNQKTDSRALSCI